MRGLAVPLTTSDILFSKTSFDDVLFKEPGNGGKDVSARSKFGGSQVGLSLAGGMELVEADLLFVAPFSS